MSFSSGGSSYFYDTEVLSVTNPKYRIFSNFIIFFGLIYTIMQKYSISKYIWEMSHAL